jgi:hypothetical protein
VTSIYMLNDPATGRTRYVGKTSNLPKRIARHLGLRSTNLHLNRWIKKVGRPEVQVALTVAGDGAREERELISLGKSQGWPLVNLTPGGEGHPGAMSAEHRAKISDTMKARGIRPTKPGRKRGHVVPQEQRTKISESHRGVSLSPAHRARISEAQRLRFQRPEERAKASRAGSKGAAARWNRGG